MTKHIVMFSGGVGSFGAAERVVARHGRRDVTLLFTDTLMEDGDLYRFLDDASEHLGIPVTRIADGRTPWQVFRDVRMIGNTRKDPCSKVLKRDIADRWLADNCDPNDTVVYLGIDWMEAHRFDDGEGRGAKHRYARNGWRAEAPLCEPPLLDKRAALARLSELGIKVPRLYKLGFEHNNCGGFCVKAGQGHFINLLKSLPQRYALHEEMEAQTRAAIGTEFTILRDRRDKKTKPLSLRELRKRVQTGGDVDPHEIGGCGCFMDEDEGDVFA